MAGDRAALVALLEQVWNGDAGAVAYHLRWPPDSGLLAERQGQPIGYAHAVRGGLHPAFTSVGVHVLPAERGRGVGGALWAGLTSRLAGPLKTAASAQDRQARCFLEARGLRVRVETHLDTLDLSGLEVGEGVEPPGFRLRPFSAWVHDAAACRAVVRLHERLYRETHRHDPPRRLSDEEAAPLFLGADLRPDWLWLAEQGGNFVGVSSVRAGEAAGEAELGWFGTEELTGPESRALTLALTRRALQAAGAVGVQTVQGEFDSVNPLAMWLRGALPFQPGRVWLTFLGAGA